MDLRRADPARGPDAGDGLAPADGFAALDQQRVVMGIGGHETALVLDQQKIAKAPDFIAGIGDDAGFGGGDRRAPGAAILMPSLCWPLGVAPNPDSTVPRTGQAKAPERSGGVGTGPWAVAGVGLTGAGAAIGGAGWVVSGGAADGGGRKTPVAP